LGEIQMGARREWPSVSSTVTGTLAVERLPAASVALSTT